MEGKPHKYGIKILERRETKSGYIHNVKIYAGIHVLLTLHSLLSIGLCHQKKNKRHITHMDRWFYGQNLSVEM
jgi:hypothetical protein